MSRLLTNAERVRFERHNCPACLSFESFSLGPRGGMCQNLQCDNCGMKLNVMYVDGRLLHAESLQDPTIYEVPAPDPVAQPEVKKGWWSRILDSFSVPFSTH
jgi:hypothetical protein